MTDYIISGIQQVGIGVANTHEGFNWYSRHFGIDIPIFEEAAEAKLMLPYTGGMAQKRHAILAINIKGGGGLELWQYTSRIPQPPATKVQLGDLGIFCVKIKTDSIQSTYHDLVAQHQNVLGPISQNPAGVNHFFLEDAFGNLLEVIEDCVWFRRSATHTGGTSGVILGVSNIEQSIPFYRDILGYDTLLFEGEGCFDDLAGLPGGHAPVKRAILTHSRPRQGSFAPLLGPSSIELIEATTYCPRKIFENRFWGDLGFIHLCFDVKNMPALKAKCEAIGHPFVVDGGDDFEMGEAAGHFTYIEDPDGTLIEFVETKKVPILKKWNWYLDLRKRKPEKPLPHWLLSALRFNRRTISTPIQSAKVTSHPSAKPAMSTIQG